MEDINTQLDRMERKERLKKGAVWGISIFIIGIMMVLIIPPMGKSTIVHGKVERLVGRPSPVGDHVYLVVTLEDGNEVRPPIPSSKFYKQGHVVTLEKKEPLYFGSTIYRFMYYEEPPLPE